MYVFFYGQGFGDFNLNLIALDNKTNSFLCSLTSSAHSATHAVRRAVPCSPGVEAAKLRHAVQCSRTFAQR